MSFICRKYSEAPRETKLSVSLRFFHSNALWPLMFSGISAAFWLLYRLVSLFTYQHECGLKWI